MGTKQIGGRTVVVHRYNTVVVGTGAVGMNCAVRLYEFMIDKGIAAAQNSGSYGGARLGRIANKGKYLMRFNGILGFL